MRLVLLALVPGMLALRLPTTPACQRVQRTAHTERVSLSRREALSALIAPAAALAWPAAALASGGATAGKTTSIPRAKIRYYGRMSEVVFAFNAVGSAVENAEAAALKTAKAAFFGDEKEGPFAELKAAGYLLAVAFKFDSKTPPDKLATVKAYKKMMAEIEKLKAALGKPKEAKAAYAAAADKLDVYLELVELPARTDARYEKPETACFFQCGEQAAGAS